MQQIKNTIILISTLLFISSCTVTQMLHERKPYVERVASIMITNDYKKIVVISPLYHYIFDAPMPVVWTLGSTFIENVKAGFSDFEVDQSNQITGEVFLNVFIHEIDAAQLQEARAAGFKRQGEYYKLSEKLNGVRYVANESINKLYTHSFGTPYDINVFEPPSAISMPMKVLLTPITLAADGVLNLGRVALLPVALVVIGAVGP